MYFCVVNRKTICKNDMRWRKQSSVWPDVEIKSSPSFPKVAQKVASPVWLKKWWFSQLPKKSPNIWATFEVKCDAKKFRKSPNQVIFLSFPLSRASKLRTHNRSDDGSNILTTKPPQRSYMNAALSFYIIFSMTRLGNLLDFGKLFKAVGNN